jgi:transposase InsO family protein
MLNSETPTLPWQKVGCDFYTWENSSYLVVVDYLSRWIENVPMKSTTSEHTVSQLKSVFSRYGIPQELISDNGPQFASTLFASFASDYGFIHTTSSPLYPQANGESERAVKTVKLLLTKAKLSDTDLHLAMLNYRSTPLISGLSPAEILMGRKLRTTLPLSSHQLIPRTPDLIDLQEREIMYKSEMSRNYDQRRRVKERPALKFGDKVAFPERV